MCGVNFALDETEVVSDNLFFGVTSTVFHMLPSNSVSGARTHVLIVPTSLSYL